MESYAVAFQAACVGILGLQAACVGTPVLPSLPHISLLRSGSGTLTIG
jgi:hypothetical protein